MLDGVCCFRYLSLLCLVMGLLKFGTLVAAEAFCLPACPIFCVSCLFLPVRSTAHQNSQFKMLTYCENHFIERMVLKIRKWGHFLST